MDEILKEELSPAHILPLMSSMDSHIPRQQQATEIDLPPLATANRSLTTDSKSDKGFTDINIRDLQLADCRDKDSNDKTAMKNSPSSVKYLISKGRVGTGGYGGAGMIDVLSPMRNMTSLSDIKQVISLNSLIAFNLCT